MAPPQFTHNLAFRPAANKRKANDSSGDEAANAKKQKENPSGPGVFGDPATSALSATQMQAQRVADVQEKYLELTGTVVYPPELGITKQVLVDNLPTLVAANFRARKTMPEVCQFIIFFGNMDKDYSIHDIFTETRVALWIPIIAFVLYQRPRTELERLFMKAWYEGRFRKHSFQWRIEYARYWASNPTAYMPRLSRDLRRKFDKFQAKIEKTIQESMEKQDDKDILDCAKTYRYLFRNRFLAAENVSDVEARKIPRWADVSKDSEDVQKSMLSKDQFEAACNFDALVSMGSDPRMSSAVQAMLVDDCMEEGDEDIDLIPGLKFRLDDIQEHVETLRQGSEAIKTSSFPSERTRFSRMTDGNEYLIGAEKYESTIRLLNGLPKGLDRCRQILESHEDIEDDSAEDNEMSVVVQDMILIAEALESIEESEGFENLIDTPIGADLQS
ncbi:hypothetical protein BLS_002157, partial [Venturia inaequalis]